MHGFEKILSAKPACLFFIILCTFLLFLNYKPISLSLANNFFIRIRLSLKDTIMMIKKHWITSPWQAQVFAENDF